MNQKSTRGVQQHEVDAAADSLLAERLRPTVERVNVPAGRTVPVHGRYGSGFHKLCDTPVGVTE